MKKLMTDYPELYKCVATGIAELTKIKDKGFNSYALTYLIACGDVYEHYGVKGLQMQLNYVLSNASHWRGDIARECKAEYKKFAKIKVS